MSTGHRHLHRGSTPELEAELSRILADSRVRKRLAAPYRFDFNYDVPYLAGYSVDGKVIYIDRHMPRMIMVQGRGMGVLPGLSRHERLEKALIDSFGWTYEKSHKFATLYEHRLYKKNKFNPASVEKVYSPYIKADEREQIKLAPKNLDLTPYAGTKLFDHLKRRMDGEDR